MKIKGLVDEDFVNYKKPSMYIAFPKCSFKCDKEAGCAICQNSQLAHEEDIDISTIEIASRYVKNPITKSIVFGGLEPFDSWTDMCELIETLRTFTKDEIIIYTGYNADEIARQTYWLGNKYNNITIKFGRFIPNQKKKYDEVLGLDLASPNQYARRIS